MSLHEPQNEWIMDTGATDHVHENEGILETLSDNNNYHSVLVGNRSPISITKTGHSYFHLNTLHNPFHIHNILITPNIIKNLISVRKFTRQTKCPIEFDKFGFTVKERIKGPANR